ncbi:NADH dehydrogenase [Sinobacterium norvegicum]|uniref:Alkyl hydroperoxide reductase subunit F n=1 Tax=Sinobacterium norvegicum TaxID=1641715 RepID=A0ABM9ACN6_9GAMM|nr:alkyl hydroperoxide reductase subunit F [Sinobacterium norvegicum]CAH0990948.1 NADH dehydrogenase [Sinobacterium norvegicum]
MLSPALNSQLTEQLANYLQHLKTPVELIAFTDNSEKSLELNSLVNEIAALSSLVNIVTADSDGERLPSMMVRSAATGSEIRFAGLPMGHEFTSLVLALLHCGGHPMKIEPELIEQVRNLDGEFHFESYISLSCQNCPDVIQALNMMAAINPQITHVMIDGALFQQEVDKRNIMAVPSVFLNDQSFSQGRISLAEIVAKIDRGAGAKQAADIDQKEAFDMLVVGAGPAGASAAIYSARKGIRTGIIADRFGGQVMDTVGIENFISVKATAGPKLVASLEEHVRDYNVDIMSNQTVSNIVAAKEVGGLIEIELQSGAKLSSHSVIMATGARWRELNVPGEQQYRGSGVGFCVHCDGPLFQGKSVAVVGGGNSGIEAAIDLAGIVEHVTVLEFSDKLLADDVLIQRANNTANIDIVLQAETTEVVGDGSKVTGLRYLDRDSGVQQHIALAGVFVQIGLVPNTDFIQGTIELTRRGEIIVDERGETSMAGVFAAGDVTTAPYKQIIIAMGSGATAALGAFDYMMRNPLLKTTATESRAA